MAEITVLDSKTIDQIAAGEVVERPASVVKELVENACDAGATAITVEIKDGGTTFIRVTDNGSGIEKDQVKRAFFRHATSKIKGMEDLARIHSLGFRGEALSSIAAVSLVEIVTKTKESLTGIRYCIEGEREREFSEVGAPEGTTIIVRDLFFNVPARKKFLKSPATEGGYIADLMEHMALSRPDISFQFQINRQTRFSTSGSGDLKEVIFRIYGREIAKEVFPFRAEEDGLVAEGFLGTPLLVRPNRNFEFFFVNRRYIRSKILSKGLENGYQAYLMQHKFPMAFLHVTSDPAQVDVNVHPSKMEVRFSDNPRVMEFLDRNVKRALTQREMIPEVSLPDGKEAKDTAAQRARQAQETAEKMVSGQLPAGPSQPASPQKRPQQETRPASGQRESQKRPAPAPGPVQPFETRRLAAAVREETLDYARQKEDLSRGRQMDLFEEKILTPQAVKRYEIIGQVFDTYWIAVYEDKMILIDQHAAHEKVKYEALIRRLKENSAESQNLLPPVVVTLSGPEADACARYGDYLAKLGFEIEPFGGNSYALRAVPCDLYGSFSGDLFAEILSDLCGDQRHDTPQAIAERIATMACKAAVKGNHRMDRREMQELLDQLLTLENPYHCPHGRPTMITMTRQELERKFKRIV